MKPAPFEYYVPASLEECLELLARYGEDGKALAGGQSLVPLLNMRLARPAAILDINRLPGLDGIEATPAGLVVGALARQRAVEHSPLVQQACPLLAEALRYVGHPTIRNRGTIGGSLAHADPAAELPAVLMALEGMVTLRSSRGERTAPATAFFKGLMMTDVHADELITEVVFPSPRRDGAQWGIAFTEVSRRHGDFALAGIAAVLALGAAGQVLDVRLAFLGVGLTPVRAGQAEALMRGQTWSEALVAEAAEAALQGLELPSDLHASATYRRKLVKVLTRRALMAAYRRVVEGSQ